MVRHFAWALLSLVVVGCGGDGSDRDASPTPTTVAATPSPDSTADARVWAAGDVIVRSDDGGLDWEVVRASGGLTRVSFADRATGWAIAPKTILRSVDGGDTWVDQTGAVDINVIRAFNDVAALSRSRAAIVGGIVPVSIGRDGPVNVRLTVDGGATWPSARVGRSLNKGQFRRVCFTDAGIGFACGGADFAGVICALSDDGGSTWRSISGRVRGGALACVGDAVLWAITGPRGLRQSTDGGASFEDRSDTLPDGVRAGRIAFATETLGWLAGRDDANRPLILHTTDGGRTWTPQVLPGDVIGRLHAVRFADARRGVAVGERTDLSDEPTALGFSTTDGGAVWRLARFPPGTPPLQGLTVVR